MSGDDGHQDGGFGMDLRRLLHRRAALGLLAAGGGAAIWAGFGAGVGRAQQAVGADGQTCTLPAAETAGPFPGDGTNARGGQTVNALAEAGIERQDITASFAGYEGVAAGIPLTLDIRLVDVTAACAPLPGRALYLWHCDAEGAYSLYTRPGANWLRGLQVSDAGGRLRFVTILPGCYDGRWPHMHFEVFASREAAVNGRAARLTSQFALPEAVVAPLYAGDGRYAASVANLRRTSLARDMVFRNNEPGAMAAMTLAVTGDAEGLTASVTVGLAP